MDIQVKYEFFATKYMKFGKIIVNTPNHIDNTS